MHLVLDKLKVLGRWIAGHKYLFVTIVFLLIIVVVDDNNMISHMKNRTLINELTNEIKSMEMDSAVIQTKLRLYTENDSDVIGDEARKRGLLKAGEDAFIIK